MRLNRVLQTTAAIGITVAATIFTISCGEDGAEGKPGTGCTITGSEVPYTVICNNEVKGQLVDGVSQGQAANGATGPQGQGCSATQSGSYVAVICGGGEPVILDACNATSSGRETIITCGATTVGLCDVTVFDPFKQYCPLTGGAPSSMTAVCGPQKEVYDAQKDYCGFESLEAVEEGTPKVLPLCADVVPKTATAADKPNEADTTAGVAGSPWELVSASVYSGDDAWKTGREYCGVTRGLKAGKTSLDTAANIVETKAKAVPIICGADTVKINEGEWQSKYCGYGSAQSLSKSILTDACGSGAGPSADAYGKKYCAMKAITNKYTDTASTYCLTGTAPDQVKMTLNKLDDKQITVLSETDYLKQYCGYEDAAAAATGTKIRITGGLCDYGTDGATPASVGPNAENTGNTWKNEFCQGIKGKPGKTKLSLVAAGGFSDNFSVYCFPDTTSSAFSDSLASSAVAETSRLNEGSWKDEYCGFTSKANVTANKFSILSDKTCDYDDSDNLIEVGPNAVNPSGASSWKNEFCQGIKGKPGKTKLVGVTGTNYRPNIGVYCIADTAISSSLVAIDAAPAEARLNDGEWKDQYCGFDDADAVTAATLSIRTGTCDYESNGTALTIIGPNAAGVSATATTWAAEFCQARKKGVDSTSITGLTGVSDWAGLSKVYCPADTTGIITVDFSDVVNAVLEMPLNDLEGIAINKGKWNDEYCGFASREAFSKLADPDVAYNATSNPRVGEFSRLTGTCDKNSSGTAFTASTGWLGPNAATLAATGSTTAWPNQFCQVTDRSSPKTSITKSTKEGNYCVSDEVDWREATPDRRLNANTWKGQYCFADFEIGTCTGGLEGNTSKKSTDPDKCVRR